LAQDLDEEDPFVVTKTPSKKMHKTPKAKHSKSPRKFLSKKKDVSDRWAYNHIKSYASFAYFPSALLMGVLMSVCLIE